jgi:hypothetical protein
MTVKEGLFKRESVGGRRGKREGDRVGVVNILEAHYIHA